MITRLGKFIWQRAPVFRRLRGRLASLEEQVERLTMAFAESQINQHGRRLEELFCYFEPKRVVGAKKVRIGTDGDGGYVMLDDLTPISVAHSLGISTDVSWDLAIAARGIPVKQYDYSIDRSPVNNPLFTFFRRKIETLNDLEEPHAPVQLLKIDIEGWEWGFFHHAPPNSLSKFRQIVVEVHELHRYHEVDWQQQALGALKKLAQTHELIHIHGNNAVPSFTAGDVQVPIDLELTYVLRSAYEFEPTDEPFPGPLDFPNTPVRNDCPLDGIVRYKA
jgi:Methyltransferase FkbM domain